MLVRLAFGAKVCAAQETHFDEDAKVCMPACQMHAQALHFNG